MKNQSLISNIFMASMHKNSKSLKKMPLYALENKADAKKQDYR
jgi:hypothetical protein